MLEHQRLVAFCRERVPLISASVALVHAVEGSWKRRSLRSKPASIPLERRVDPREELPVKLVGHPDDCLTEDGARSARNVPLDERKGRQRVWPEGRTSTSLMLTCSGWATT